MMKRSELIDQIKQDPQVDVLIVGAGINGIGTFRDLALNNVKTLIIDRADFCSGASTASSHMAHGGIRYLENGEFRLVEEAVRERNRMIENAAHVVKPLPTTIPIFKFWSGLLNAPFKFLNLLDKPAERGAFVIKFGLIMYDSFTRKQKTVPRHQFFGRTESLKRHPRLNSKIQYTARYYDGQILSPERYSLDLITDAMAEGPHAKALNYVSLAQAEPGKVTLRDELSGEEFTVAPKILINAAGPWIDPVNKAMGIDKKYIGGTKGSHLVVDNPELRKAIGTDEFFFENKDGRIVLIFPFYDKVIIGTSDLPIDDADTARCTPEEEKYFIDLVARVFPDIPVKQDQIVFRFTGVRPLEFSHAKTAGQITRDHSIKEDVIGDLPVLSLVGGKWTSYRAFSAQVTDQCLSLLKLKRKKNTESIGIGGGKDYPKTEADKASTIDYVAEKSGLSKEDVAILFDRYGTRCLPVAKAVAAEGKKALKSLPDWKVGEVYFLVEQEMPLHVEDLLLRRSTLGWLGQVNQDVLEEMADLFAKKFGWNGAEKKKEIERTIEVFKDLHGVTIH
ncbi:MAG: glycerol-3-phosphate dehydrogenase/oxidase [Anaerolineaceae bacterium]|nr:glycerol-3-phosphate dehydrogenase/oxidase [Anaerolineaceae bacterium]